MAKEKIYYARQDEIDNLRSRKEIIKLPVPEALLMFVHAAGGTKENIIRYINSERGVETWIENTCAKRISEIFQCVE